MSVSQSRSVFMAANDASVQFSKDTRDLSLFCPVFVNGFYGTKFIPLVCEKIKQAISDAFNTPPSWEEFCHVEPHIYAIASAYGFYTPNYAITVYELLKGDQVKTSSSSNSSNISYLTDAQNDMIAYERSYWKLCEANHKRITA